MLDLCSKAAKGSDSGIVVDLDIPRHRPGRESCYLVRCRTMAGRQAVVPYHGPWQADSRCLGLS